MVQSLFDHYEFSLLSLLSENLQVHKVCPSISRITTIAELLRQLEFVTSSRGTPQILLDRFLYSKTTTRRTAQPDRQHNQTDSTARQTAQHWRYVNKTCPGKYTTVGDVLGLHPSHRNETYSTLFHEKISTFFSNNISFPERRNKRKSVLEITKI